MKRRIVCAVLASLFLARGPMLARDAPEARLSADAYIHTTIRDDLPSFAYSTLRTEATRIWADHRVILTWGTEPVNGEYDIVVPVTFDHAQVVRKREGRHQVLARTVFGRPTVVHVSVPRARSMLRSIKGHGSLSDNDGARDVRLGLLLGRVVAHEIGHVLLSSVSHAGDGLMRPQYHGRDVIVDDDSLTALTDEDRHRIAMRFSLIPLAPTVVSTCASRGAIC